MSLLDDRPTNPAKYFLEVKSGKVQYYDKDTKQNIEVPTPLRFIVLDQLSTVKGWSDEDESGFWSNEVKSVGRDELTVRTSKGLKDRGLWRDIKNSPALAGAKYNAVIYIAHQSTQGMVISNLRLTGAALKAWIEFNKKNNVKKSAVVLQDWSDEKKGAVNYKAPIFVAETMEEHERDEALKLAQELKTYHDEYFSYTPDTHNAPNGAKKDEVVDDFDDEEPINLDDIPF